MSIKHFAMCFVINSCLHQFSHSFFIRYTAGDIYEFMQKEGNWTTETPTRLETQESCDFLPKMMIFEPDGVFWPFVVGTDIVKPFQIKRMKELIDNNGTVLSLHKECVKSIVHLVKKGVKVSVAETTNEIIVMRHLLHLFDLDHLFDFMELDPESPVDHVKIIKEESGFDYEDLIYFGTNKQTLKELKRALNITTILVNPESGISIKHIYRAIYIYNIKPYTQIVNGKAQYIGKIASEENINQATSFIRKLKQQRASEIATISSSKTKNHNKKRKSVNLSKREKINEKSKMPNEISIYENQTLISSRTTAKIVKTIETLKPQTYQYSVFVTFSASTTRTITKIPKTKVTLVNGLGTDLTGENTKSTNAQSKVKSKKRMIKTPKTKVKLVNCQKPKVTKEKTRASNNTVPVQSKIKSKRKITRIPKAKVALSKACGNKVMKDNQKGNYTGQSFIKRKRKITYIPKTKVTRTHLKQSRAKRKRLKGQGKTEYKT